MITPSHLYYLIFAVSTLFTSSYQAQNEAFTMTQLGPNNMLDKPWDLHYGPDAQLWVTERESGRVLRVDPESGVKDELLQISDVFTSSRQDGLLGIALHDGLLGEDPYVYLSYTYSVAGDRVQKIVRYTYAIADNDGTLSDPIILIDNLPASNDHNSGRLVFGPDSTLYYTIGDQGGNQNSNYCNPVLSQFLPTQEEIDSLDWSNYPGKTLRLNTDGSIPEDNPVLDSVQSHIYSYGHRNAQGIVFGANGNLYADEHGPDTDDEVNIIASGMNYGWPKVVGFKDDQAYDYCNWSSLDNCSDLDYSKANCPTGADFVEESSFTAENYMEPIFSMFAVTDDYDFNNPICGSSWMCRPNVAPSSLAIYESDAIPGWGNSLLVTSLKRGRVYRLQLDEAGNAITGDTTQHFYTTNRYRDIVVHPNGKSIFMITDQEGNTSDASGLNIERTLQNPGTILKFTLQESVSVSEVSSRSIFELSPNPASAQINIDIKAIDASSIKGHLISSSGQVVKAFNNLRGGLNTVSIDDQAAGIYFIRISTEERSWNQKLIIY